MSVNLTEEQAGLLFGKRTTVPRKPREKKSKVTLPENQVEQQITDFLRAKGWTVTRRHVGVFVPYHVIKSGRAPQGCMVRIGETGEADWECIRPDPLTDSAGAVNHFHLECKGPGKEPKPEQLDWMRKRKAQGFIAVWFDGLDTFASWYRATFV